MDLENRIARLEAVEAIRRLKYEHYCLAVDRGVCRRDPDAFAPLVERLDAEVDVHFTGVGAFHGKPAAAEFLSRGVPDMLSWCHHRVGNPMIDVHGDTADGTWYLFCPAVGTERSPTGAGPLIIVGRYVESYRRVGDRWLWTKLHAQMDVLDRMDAGWASAAWAD